MVPRGANGSGFDHYQKEKVMPGDRSELNSLDAGWLLTLPNYQNVYGGGCTWRYAFPKWDTCRCNAEVISKVTGPKLILGFT